MTYERDILVGMQYIEAHLKEPLIAEEIAEAAGYSLYHYARIFKEQTGSSLMEYAKERKLLGAAKEIYEGKRIIDVAMTYGYETQSGFTKAFRKKFGFTPALLHAIGLSCELFQEEEGRRLFMKASIDFKTPEVLYQELVDLIKLQGIRLDLSELEKAYQMAQTLHEGECRKSGEPYIIHPLCVAKLLVEMEAEPECILAGLLHEIVENPTKIALEEVASSLSLETARLVKEMGNYEIKAIEDQEVLLIKLADRLHNMRTMKFMEPEKVKEKARETLAIFSPLASRLGIEKLKRELDDLALKWL